MNIKNLTLRNIKLYFKDKGVFITSLITPLILILLYVTFLKNVYVDSFNNAVMMNGIEVADKYINGFVHGWLFSSLVAVSSVTVAFCSNILMVQDKYLGTRQDINITPVDKKEIAISYYLGAVISTSIIITIELIICFIIMALSGWFLTISDVLMIIVSSFILVNFGVALSSLIHYFLKSQGQVSAVGTLVSTVYGFIAGAYMPISQFGNFLQKILSFLPSTYGTGTVRHYFLHSVLSKLETDCGFPKEVTDNISQNFDIKLSFFNNDVSHVAMLIILTLSTLLILGIYIVLNNQKKRKINVA